jgi:protein-arginine kinase activator protein McsA
MLCEKCQQREATCHITNVQGDSMAKSDLCEDCYRSSEVAESPIFESKCTYCGGEGIFGTSISGPGREQAALTLCERCVDEYFSTMKEKMSPELPEEKLLAEVDEHMKKWVKGRDDRP